MIVSELSTQVNDLLRPMGITRNLSAYSILCQCLELVCEQEDRLQAAWWKNNSFTPAALQADQTYDKLKAQGK